MEHKIIDIAVRELAPGDQVINKGRNVYKVISIDLDEPDKRVLYIQWVDGGFDFRVWDSSELLEQRIEVIR